MSPPCHWAGEMNNAQWQYGFSPQHFVHSSKEKPRVGVKFHHHIPVRLHPQIQELLMRPESQVRSPQDILNEALARGLSQMLAGASRAKGGAK